MNRTLFFSVAIVFFFSIAHGSTTKDSQLTASTQKLHEIKVWQHQLVVNFFNKSFSDDLILLAVVDHTDLTALCTIRQNYCDAQAAKDTHAILAAFKQAKEIINPYTAQLMVLQPIDSDSITKKTN